MTCKCGHLSNDHARMEGSAVPQECFKCDCLKFVENTKVVPKLSEACEWASHEFCEVPVTHCQCSCHLFGA